MKIVPLVVLGACAPPTCVEEFSVDEGYAFTSDTTGAGTLADIEAECAADGAPACDVVVTRAAAECIADEDGLGAANRRATIAYNSTFAAIVWNVFAGSSSDTTTTATGSGRTIDAGTGEILQDFDWTAIP